MIMLNLSTYTSGPTRPVHWRPSTSYSLQESILAWERRHTTQLLSWGGADAHGWRNALNYFGWGSMRAGVYRDQAFDSFDEAARATVISIALYRKPVGILAWGGVHAQLVSGYKVSGEDPRTGSAKFTVLGVYLTDPLKRDAYRDRYVDLATWRSGGKRIKFIAYKMTNSPYVDPIDGNKGNAEWDGRWVIVAPVA